MATTPTTGDFSWKNLIHRSLYTWEGQILLAALVWSAIHIHWLAFRWGNPAFHEVISTAFFVPLALAVVVLTLRIGVSQRFDARMRRTWLLLGCAYGAYLLGALLSTGYTLTIGEVPSASLADAAYLSFYPFALAALLTFPTTTQQRGARSAFWLDIALVSLSSAMGMWRFVLEPQLSQGSENWQLLVLALAYPLGDLAVTFGLAVAALRGAPGNGRMTLRILIIAFVASIIASVGYASLLLQELYDYTSWPNALWSLSYCGVIASACYHYWYAAEPGAVTTSVSETPDDMFAWLPYLTIAFGYGVFFFSAVAEWETRHSPLIIIATILTGVLVVRQERALRAERVARHESAQARRMLEQINHELEQRVNQRTAELALALEDVKQHAARQAALLAALEQQRDIIREMSVPVLPVGHDTLIMPLVGALDSARLAQVEEQALERLETSRARRLVLDITGVPTVDAQVAQGLVRVVQAARLLGASTTLVGIRPEVAQSIVNLGLDLSHIHTESDLQNALALQWQASL